MFSVSNKTRCSSPPPLPRKNSPCRRLSGRTRWTNSLAEVSPRGQWTTCNHGCQSTAVCVNVLNIYDTPPVLEAPPPQTLNPCLLLPLSQYPIRKNQLLLFPTTCDKYHNHCRYRTNAKLLSLHRSTSYTQLLIKVWSERSQRLCLHSLLY